MTEKQFYEKMKKFDNENYEVIYSGKNSADITKVKCLDCGTVISSNTGELFRARRKTLCSKCHGAMRSDTLKNREVVLKKLENKATNIEFFMDKESENGNNGDKVKYICNKCGCENDRWVVNIIRNTNDSCLCKYCEGQKLEKNHYIYQKELNEIYPDKFTLLTEYKSATTDIKVKCNNCGFIRDVKPAKFLESGFCPKCDKKTSKGEKAIMKYLTEHNIEHETQKYFKDWKIGLHYFDFYVSSINSVIEFHGIQHYEYNKHFHKNIQDFNYRKEKDELKKEKCLSVGINYISIKYTEIDFIEDILNKVISSTTIPSGSRGKCLEIESFLNIKEEDIVWS